MTSITKLILAVVLCSLVAVSQAVPTTGSPTGITSNSVNISVTNLVGTSAYVEYGANSGGEMWYSDTWNVTSNATTVVIYGAPLIGGQTYYAKACDDTGCGNEVSFTLSAITPLPTTTYGAQLQSMMITHFSILYLAGQLFAAYTNVVPATVMFGIIFGMIVIGIWYRTKSVRLIGILMMISSPFIVDSNSGLMLGIPLVEQAIGQALLAAGFAGIMLSFIKK